MKFFSELGSCYRPTTSAPSHQQKEDEAIHVAPPLPSSRHHAKRLNKLGGGPASSASHNWRPRLQAIREDGVVLDLKGKSTTARRPHPEKKSKDRYYSNPRRVSHNDDYFSGSKYNSAPMIIPAFSPTPFMF